MLNVPNNLIGAPIGASRRLPDVLPKAFDALPKGVQDLGKHVASQTLDAVRKLPENVFRVGVHQVATMLPHTSTKAVDAAAKDFWNRMVDPKIVANVGADLPTPITKENQPRPIITRPKWSLPSDKKNVSIPNDTTLKAAPTSVPIKNAPLADVSGPTIQGANQTSSHSNATGVNQSNSTVINSSKSQSVGMGSYAPRKGAVLYEENSRKKRKKRKRR